MSSEFYDNDKKSSMTLFWQQLHHDFLIMIGLYGVLAFIILTFFGSWIAPYELNQTPVTPLLPSAWSDVGDIEYFFGTDNYGRDILSRLIYATKSTFGSGLFIALIVNITGIIMGIWAGITRGIFSAFLNHIFDVFMSIPSLLVAVTVVVFLGPSLENAIIAISLSFLPRVIHTIFRAVRDELEKEYIIALRLDGATTRHILKDDIFPNITVTIINEFSRIWSMAILEISVLGFLGLAAQSPRPEWGAMLRDMKDLYFINPSMLILPGLAILLSILCINLLGNGIQRIVSNRGEYANTRYS